MKKFLFLLVSCILCSIGFAQVNVIETELQEVMNQKGGEMIDVTISFTSQMDAAKLQAKAKRGDKSLQREIVVSELKDFSLRQQSDVMAILQAEEASGNVANINALWIVNAISCEASRDVIYKLASHPDVAKLSYNKEIQLLSEEQMSETAEAQRGPAAHVVTINADDVWGQQNYTGRNVVVAVLDSGTNIYHNDLKDHLWEGEVEGEIVNGWNFSVNNGNSNIIDDNGHGTHCAGIVCGDGTSGTTTGIAPDALLMTVKVLGRTGTGSVDNMIAGVQFAVENGADILSMSLGYKAYQISVAQKELIRDAFDAVLTSGAIVCAAVGNDGNTLGAPYNVDYPAACPSPWKNPDQTLAGGLSSVIAVGANDLAASSQGPSTWQDTDFNDYQYSKWTHYCAFTNSFDDYGGTYSSQNSFKWAVKYTPNMLNTYAVLNKVSIHGPKNNTTVNIYVYEGGETEPGTLLHSQQNVSLNSNTWNEIALSESVEIDPTKNVWLVFEGYMAAYGRTFNSNVNSRYLYDGESWTGYTQEDANGNNLNVMWLVRGYFEDNGGNTSTVGLIRPDITAPGNMIYSLNSSFVDKYKLESGTSQSTPAVAGVIALMLEKNPSLTPAQIAQIIETTAANKPAGGKNNSVGAGRVDALAAVNATEAGEQSSYMSVFSFSPKTLVTGDNKNINVIIENQGHKATTSEAQYTISVNDDPYVTVVGSNTVALGAVEPQGIKETSFKVNVNADTPNGHVVYITLTLQDGSMTRKENIAIKVEKLPHVVYKTHTPGQIKPEDGNVNLNVTMVNDGTAAMANSTDVTLKTISNSLNHFDIIDDEATVPPLGVGETATATFVIKAKEDAKDGYLLDLFLETFSNNTTPMSFVYGFETGMEGWTSFDAANNNIETPWWHSSDAVAHGLDVVDSHSGNGHIMSETMIRSNGEQFYNYPIDNYVVSPNKLGITENSEISFYARANFEAYYQEHFGLAVSETGNADESDFTLIKEWDITESTKSWNKYTVDLSQYKGKEIYVAIRHFFTEQQWESLDYGYNVEALDIDDICLSDVIIDFQHTTTYDGTDENYFNVAIFNPVDLDAPTGLDVTGRTTESITLIWDELANAQSYNVYRNGEKVANVEGTSYTDNGLTHNTEYCYTVAGMNNVYEHEHSEELCVTTVQKDYSVAISMFEPEIVIVDGKPVSLNITFVNDGKKEHDTWSRITLSSEDEFVTTITPAQVSWSPAPAPGSETTKTFAFTLDENIPNNHEIQFNANVKYNNSETSWDIPFTMVVKNDPNSPKNLNATATGNSVALSWDVNANAKRYKVYRDDEHIATTAATKYIDGDIEAETEYTYYVRSITIDGSESEKSNEVTLTTNAEGEGVVVKSYTMGSAIGEEVELTATLINNGSEATPAETMATLTCTDPYVTIVSEPINIGSIAAGATKDAVFTIILDEDIPANYNLAFNVTVQYEGEGGGDATTTYSYGFDDGFEGWTSHSFNDTYSWYHFSDADDYSSNYPETPYNGEGYILNAAYMDWYIYDANDVIWSPIKVKIGDDTKISFYVRPRSDNTRFSKETYSIVYSTADSNPQEYNGTFVSHQITDGETGVWNYKEHSLSSQKDQELWIGILHTGDSNDADGICIDELKISDAIVSGGSSTITYVSSFSVIANQSLNTFAGTGSWSNASLWSKGLVPSTTDDVIVAGDATIESGNITVNTLSIEEGTLTMNGGALTVSGLLVNTDADAFVINNGAQVIQNNDNVAATVNMDIVDWNKWQFIASPVKDIEIEGFVPSTGYDLFKYDGTQKDAEWVNYQGHVADFEETFQQGRGYLASYETETTATFKGVLNKKSSFTFSDVKAHDEENYYANFYLLGNPFTFNMDMNNLDASGMETGIAVINATGNGYEYRTSGSVNVGEGFFVKTAAATASLSYSEGAKRGNDNVAAINLIATSKAGNDNVIIRLAGADNEGFNKLDNLDRGVAEIYVHNDGNRYGIKSFDENTTEVEVAFHANEMGNYTIAAVAEGDFSSVVLLDRFTGVETNLLVEDYGFTATSRDDQDRFIVKLVNGQQSADNSHFAYVSGEDLILEAEGTVQIIDVMGRMVYSNDVEGDNNRIDVSNFRNGAYVVRLINEEGVKVQKIIL